jgi:hypothetical protein
VTVAKEQVGAGCTFTVSLLLFYLFAMTMFDEMGVGIHLPIGNLNTAPQLDVKDTIPPIDHKQHLHHDEESQLYSQRISIPLQR